MVMPITKLGMSLGRASASTFRAGSGHDGRQRTAQPHRDTQPAGNSRTAKPHRAGVRLMLAGRVGGSQPQGSAGMGSAVAAGESPDRNSGLLLRDRSLRSLQLRDGSPTTSTLA